MLVPRARRRHPSRGSIICGELRRAATPSIDMFATNHIKFQNQERARGEVFAISLDLSNVAQMLLKRVRMGSAYPQRGLGGQLMFRNVCGTARRLSLFVVVLGFEDDT
jgi:hypothetical protein